MLGHGSSKRLIRRRHAAPKTLLTVPSDWGPSSQTHVTGCTALHICSIAYTQTKLGRFCFRIVLLVSLLWLGLLIVGKPLQFDSMTTSSRRKLCALALCAVLPLKEKAVLERLEQIIRWAAYWITLHFGQAIVIVSNPCLSKTSSLSQAENRTGCHVRKQKPISIMMFAKS
jgi:hypothetical protein